MQQALGSVADIEEISQNAIAPVVQLVVFDLSTVCLPKPSQKYQFASRITSDFAPRARADTGLFLINPEPDLCIS